MQSLERTQPRKRMWGVRRTDWSWSETNRPGEPRKLHLRNDTILECSNKSPQKLSFTSEAPQVQLSGWRQARPPGKNLVNG